MKPIAYTLVVAALCFALSAQGKPVPKSVRDPKDDKEKIEKAIGGFWQGTISVAHGNRGGNPSKWNIRGGTIIWTQLEKHFYWKYRVISAGPPAQIDLFPDVGSGANKTLPGIIKVEQDTLTVCFIHGRLENPERMARPTKFGVATETDYVTLTFRRIPADAAK